jgi:hypothetical protein
MEVILTSNFQPDILWLGQRIGEPVVCLTSILISLSCLYAWWKLRGCGVPGCRVTRMNRSFFVFMGLSTLIGGVVGHALIHSLHFSWKSPGWVTGMVGIGLLGQASILRAREHLSAQTIRWLTAINAAAFLLCLGLVAATLWFPIVEIHTAFGLLLMVGGVEGYLHYKNPRSCSRYLLLSIPFAVLAAVAHVAKFSLCRWFTYFDIGHVLVCASIFMILKSAQAQAGGPFGTYTTSSKIQFS